MMKFIRVLLFLTIVSLAPLPIVRAQETSGLALYPALIEPADTQDSYDLTVENRENDPLTIEFLPWIFEYKDGRIVPATSEVVSLTDLDYIKIANSRATLEPDKKFTTKISFDPNSLPADKYAGVLARTLSDGEFQLNASIGSVILSRGIPSEEVLEVEIVSRPRITFTRDVEIEYSVKNNGRYLAKPNGEIEVIRNGQSRVKGIQITSKIGKNIFFDERISDKLNFQIPTRDEIFKESGKYDFKITVHSSSGTTYSQTSSVYYFNPLLILVMLIMAILILIILLTARKLLRRAD